MIAIHRLLSFLTLIIVAGLCWPVDRVDGWAEPLALAATRVAGPPSLDGDLADAVWDKVAALMVPVSQPISSSGVGDVEVELRAAHDGQYVYVAASWPDPTESIVKARWLRRDGTWVSDATQDEDRLALMFDSGGVTGFGERGCQALCHGDAMHTPAPGERVDVWHWKAARTHPMAYADDEWWDHTPASVTPDGGRKPDASAPGRSGPASNKAGAAPAYMFAPGAVPGPFLYLGDAAPFSPDTTLETLPGYLLKRARGSRADVTAVAQWVSGCWTVELRRRLDTGHGDDVVFVPGGSTLFSLAIFENLTEELGHGNHGRAIGPYRLVLAP